MPSLQGNITKQVTSNRTQVTSNRTQGPSHCCAHSTIHLMPSPPDSSAGCTRCTPPPGASRISSSPANEGLATCSLSSTDQASALPPFPAMGQQLHTSNTGCGHLAAHLAPQPFDAWATTMSLKPSSHINQQPSRDFRTLDDFHHLSTTSH